MAITTYSDNLRSAIQTNFADAPGSFYLLVFDISKWAPWHWCSALTATCTLIIYFYSDNSDRVWKRRRESEPHAEPYPYHINRLLGLTRIRSLSTGILLLLSLGYAGFVLSGTSPHHLPNGLSFLTTLYGPYLP